MRAFLIPVLLSFSLSPLAHATEVRFGSLQVDWPDGYTVTSTKPPFELAGPSGQKVLVSVMRIGKEQTAEAAATEQERVAGEMVNFVQNQASKVGKVIVQPHRTALPDGSVLLYAGSETSGVFSSGYFLQYIVVSPTARIAFFTAEGKGQPQEHHEVLLPVLSSARWLP